MGEAYLIEIMAMRRHEKVRILAAQNIHEIFARSGLALEEVLERDIAGRVVFFPVQLVKRSDFHGRSLGGMRGFAR
jgi:hypothetical protein